MKDPMSGKPRLKLMEQSLQLAQIDDWARRQALAVLEVLGGLRTTDQAAAALEISVPTYFQLETRALRGLIWACTPNPPGRQQALGRRLRDAQATISGLEQQVQRYQALLRSAQRAVGLSGVPAPSKPPADKRKARKPAVRALRVIHLLQGAAAASPGEPGAAQPAVAAAGAG